MTILVLSALVSACSFCFVALVNFHREIGKARQNKVRAAKVLSLDREQGFYEPEFDASTLTPNGAWDEHRKSSCSSRSGNSAGGAVKLAPSGPRKVYQLESAYLGPFFVIPLRKQEDTEPSDQDHSAPCLVQR